MTACAFDAPMLRLWKSTLLRLYLLVETPSQVGRGAPHSHALAPPSPLFRLNTKLTATIFFVWFLFVHGVIAESIRVFTHFPLISRWIFLISLLSLLCLVAKKTEVERRKTFWSSSFAHSLLEKSSQGSIPVLPVMCWNACKVLNYWQKRQEERERD